MPEKNYLNKNFLAISLISLFIPGSWFTATRSDVDLFVIKVLLFLTILVFLFSLVLSSILKKFLKEDFFNILSSVLIFIFIFFSFNHVLYLIKNILKNNLLEQQTEISIISTLMIGFIFFFLSLKKNKFIIRFVTVLFPLLLIINIINSFISIKSDLPSENLIVSKTKYLDITKIQNIKKKNNKNIYYVSLDGAVTLDFFNNKVSSIDLKKINNQLKKNNFKVVPNIKSDYFRQLTDLDSLAISEIFNLGKFKSAKNIYEVSNFLPAINNKNFFLKKCKIYMCDVNGKKLNLTDYNPRNFISSAATFPTILRNFETTSLGITLEKIDYNFFWVGSLNSNCIYFNSNICLGKKKSLVAKARNFFNFNDMYKSNYVLRNYLHSTPLIKVNYKLNEMGFRLNKNLKNAQHQADSIKRFTDNAELKKKNSFTFIHFGLPKINFINNNVPVVFNRDCSIRKINKKINFFELGSEKLHYFNVDNFNEFYKSNYLCMLKRVIEFTNFINKHDSEAQVIIQAGHNVPIFENETKRNEYHLLTIAKINKNCEDNLKDIQNHIDAVKLLISCSLK